MKDYPVVSVIMGVYNEEDNVGNALKSLIRQTLENIEIIVVDDGSSDATVSIVKKMQAIDSRIKLIKKRHAGLSVALNAGLRQSHGKFIARMDADDYSYHNRFEVQHRFLIEHPEIAMVGSFCRVHEEGRPARVYSFPTEDKDIRAHLPWENPFSHPTVMFRRNVLEDVGGYDPVFKKGQDYELWSRIVPHYKVANMPVILLDREERRQSVTNREIIPLKSFYYGFKIRLLVLKRGSDPLSAYGALVIPFWHGVKHVGKKILFLFWRMFTK